MPWALQDSLELCGATKGFSARTSRSQPRSCSEGVKDHIEGGLGDLWARHAPQLGCSHNLTTSLAAVLWVAGIAISRQQAANWPTALRAIVIDLFVTLSARLDAWAIAAADAPLQTTIMTQDRGQKRVRRWPYILHAKANQLRRPRLATEEQDTAARCKTINSAANVEKGNFLYLAEKRRRMEPCKCYEIVLDGVPLASTNYDLSLTYCTEIDAAGFNVPIESRALKWRCRTEDKVVWTWAMKPSRTS